MIECIPNFSEGQRRDVIDAIAAAIGAVSGVLLLDIHADTDHNRAVVTFAAPAAVVGEAAFQGVKTAARLIDMHKHRGVHPRIGATDVLPFVPLRDATMDECVVIARAVAQRIGSELGISTYLYGAAALRDEYRELPALRRGQYEGLRTAIGSDPARAPDFGPRQLGTAGATVVGARAALVAYNLYLNTADLAVARRIARAVRGSSGGLANVRALGLLVGGRAQISMNVLNYQATPLHRVVACVAHEAALYGVAITEAELVGLVPEDALLAGGRAVARLHHIGDAQVLERRLAQVAGTVEWWRTPAAPDRATPEPHADSGSTLAQQADQIWRASVRALAQAAQDLATDEPNRWVRSMLRTLSQALPALMQQADEQGVQGARALLLIGRLAATLTEVLDAKADPTDDSQQVRVTSVYLAQEVAAGARLRALPILTQLNDDRQIAMVEELAWYVQRTREAVATLDRVEG